MTKTKKHEEKRKAGRVNKYDTVIFPNLVLIQQWAREGMLEKDIAKNLKIGLSNFYRYKAERTEFREALKNNEAIANAQVENAFFKRCVGYEYEEETKELREGEMILTKVVKKQVYPDTEAAAKWMYNRMPQRWKNTQSIDFNGKMAQTNSVDISALTALSADELRKLALQADDKPPKIIDIPTPDKTAADTVVTDNDYQ